MTRCSWTRLVCTVWADRLGSGELLRLSLSARGRYLRAWVVFMSLMEGGGGERGFAGWLGSLSLVKNCALIRLE